MNIPLLAAYNLTHDPFAKSIADADLWLPPSKQGLVDGLTDTISQRHWALITGEPGVGKTCVLRALRQRLSAEQYRLTYCCNSTLGRRDFYRQLCHAVGVVPQATAAGVFNALTGHVHEIARDNVQPVFLIDEAHLMHQDVLDHLHILGNYQWDAAPLLTIVLIGLPELEDRLDSRRNRSLYSRISGRYRIGTMQPEDTAEYVRQRMVMAGCTADVFPKDTIGLLHEYTGGVMRDTDRVARLALAKAANAKSRLVERTHISKAIHEDRAPRP